MIKYIWSLFIILGIVISIIKGDNNLTNNLLTSGSSSINMIINMIPIICLWMGLMKVAESSGLLTKISKRIAKYICFLFPEIPKDSIAIGYISSNIVMNMLGLGNAATPLGLKAMKELKKINSNTDEASRSMITFLAINTSSVTIIPTTVISLRVLNGSTNPSEIITSSIIATVLSTLFALIIDRLFYFIWRKHA